MENFGEYLKISELSKRSGVSAKKIRYYIKKEILPKPIKINKTSAFYTKQHLERLLIIKKLNDDNQLPISLIKELSDSITQTEGQGTTSQPENPSLIREQLISSGTEVFRKKGYEGTTITDIVEAANISRNTFYRYFKSKEELFIECLNEIIIGWRRSMPRGPDPLTELEVREGLVSTFLTIHKAYPKWSDMMNLLRVAALKDPQTFGTKLQASMDTRIKPIIDDVTRWVKQGIFREVNTELLAIMLAGIAEYLCFYIYRGKFSQEPSEIGRQILDILFHGILRSTKKEKGQ